MISGDEVGEGDAPTVEVVTGGAGGGGGGGDVNYKRKMEDEGDEEERSAKNPRSASPDFTSLKVQCTYIYCSVICTVEYTCTCYTLKSLESLSVTHDLRTLFICLKFVYT